MSFYRKTMLKVRLCPQAREEHRKSQRQFAHTLHRKNVICVTPEFYDLPYTFQAGILLHELGHVQLGDHKHTEADADRIAFYISGVHLVRRSYHDAKRLEAVREADLKEAQLFLRRYVDRSGPMDELL